MLLLNITLDRVKLSNNIYLWEGDAVQNHEWHMVVISCVLQSVTVPHFFLDFHDLNNFEDYGSVIL